MDEWGTRLLLAVGALALAASTALQIREEWPTRGLTDTTYLTLTLLTAGAAALALAVWHPLLSALVAAPAAIGVWGIWEKLSCHFRFVNRRRR